MRELFVVAQYIFICLFFCSCGHSVGSTSAKHGNRVTAQAQSSNDTYVRLYDRINHAIWKEQEFEPTAGPSFKAKKATPSEMEKIFKSDRGRTCKFPVYIFETSGFCPGDSYSFYFVDGVLRKSYQGTYTVNSLGNLISNQNGELITNSHVSCGRFAYGEQCSSVLVPKDGGNCIAAVMTPYPIEYTWDDGAYVYLILESLDACLFKLIGKGFAPDEKLVITSKSCDECIASPFKASPAGTVIGFYAPAVVNKTGGRASIKIKREKVKKAGILKYWWGKEAIERSQQENLCESPREQQREKVD